MRRRHAEGFYHVAGLDCGFCRVQQIWAGEDIEEIHRFDLTDSLVNRASVLLMAAFDITISRGWPRGWWVGCVVTNILSAPASLLFIFQSLRIASDSCGRLSKRHWS
jgi:hypothetical protein